MKTQILMALALVWMLAACTDDSAWHNDPTVLVARDACKSRYGIDYDCIEHQAVTALNPEICRLAGTGIDDMCLQAVYEAADDPSICDRIYLRGAVPNCRAYYAQHTPATPTLIPTKLTPLLPTWTVTPAGASDLDLARHTLLTFFTLLHDGHYTEATSLYGGDYETMRVQNPDVAPDDYAALWQATCTHQTPCLLVSRIVEEKSIAQDEFEFVMEFIWIDGTLFKLGPCCGATEAEMPPVWQFPYTVKKIDGQFQVMEGPVYIP